MADPQVEDSVNTNTKVESTEEEPTKQETSTEDKLSKSSEGNSNKRSEGRDFGNRKGNDRFSAKKWAEYRENVKTDYSTLAESSDPDEIRKQVEFYFSDSNMAYDDHMYKLAGEGNSVPVKVIHSFKRMRRFQPYSAVVEALKESSTLEIIGDDEIKRKVTFTRQEDVDEFHDPSIPRSIYAKGFGIEGSTTQFDIESLFAPYGPINMVRLRRSYPERHFKGSVFVEFENEELQKQFLEMENKPKWNGEDLLIMSKRQYCDKKLEDIKAGKISAKQANQYKQYVPKKQFQERSNSNRFNRRDGGRDRGRSRRDRDDWKGRRDDFQKNGFKERKNERGGAEEKDEIEKDDNGIPVVKPSSVPDEDFSAKKRARDDDDDGEEIEAKKTKADDEVAAATS